MNKLTLLSLVAATVLFTACGEDAKKAVTDAATSATETVKETAAHAVEATKEAATEATASATEAVKEAASDAVDSAKEAAATAVAATKEKASEVAEAATQKAADAATALKERAAATTAAAAAAVTPSDERPAVEPEKKEVAAPVAADNAAGKAAYAKCAGCHGVDGKTQALGKSAIIAGQAVLALETSIAEYKAGTRNVSGMGMLMKGQVASMDEATIKAVSEYISGL